MGLSKKYKEIPPSEIKVRREERQRREIDVSDIIDSIRQRGVYSPILVTQDLVLVAGERRLTAAIQAGLATVPCRLVSENTSPTDLQIIELEENLKRKDLPWRDEVKAVARIHELYERQDEAWTQAKTGEAINLAPGSMTRYLRVAAAMENPKVSGAQGIDAAYNVLSRLDTRAAGDAISEIIEQGSALVAEKLTVAVVLAEGEEPQPEPEAAPAPESILQTDFLTWAETYVGPKFNFIHCDFPYGIEVFGGAQSGKNTSKTYDDSSFTYLRLIDCLAGNLDRLMSHSGHLMFWLSADIDIIARTKQAFQDFAPSLVFWPKPLIWHKTDNVGILADPKRTPRHIYEVALVASREDRLLAKAKSDLYGAPTDKTYHPSTKPEPMLRYFFEMFVDEGTRLLDPTCGSGSALRAAESLGAKAVLGLEADLEHCTAARQALRKFRALRGAAK